MLKRFMVKGLNMKPEQFTRPIKAVFVLSIQRLIATPFRADFGMFQGKQ